MPKVKPLPSEDAGKRLSDRQEGDGLQHAHPKVDGNGAVRDQGAHHFRPRRRDQDHQNPQDHREGADILYQPVFKGGGMTARCVSCGHYWNVCVQKQFPPGGYICPWCTGRGRERRNHADVSRHKEHEKGRDHTKGGGTGAWL